MFVLLSLYSEKKLSEVNAPSILRNGIHCFATINDPSVPLAIKRPKMAPNITFVVHYKKKVFFMSIDTLTDATFILQDSSNRTILLYKCNLH